MPDAMPLLTLHVFGPLDTSDGVFAMRPNFDGFIVHSPYSARISAINILSPVWQNLVGFSLPDCLCHVSSRKYSPLCLEVVEKQNKCKSFLVLNFWEGRPRCFYGRLLAPFIVLYCSPFGIV